MLRHVREITNFGNFSFFTRHSSTSTLRKTAAGYLRLSCANIGAICLQGPHLGDFVGRGSSKGASTSYQLAEKSTTTSLLPAVVIFGRNSASLATTITLP